MPLTTAAARELFARNRWVVEWSAVALAAVAALGVIGVKAERALGAARADLAAAQGEVRSLEAFRRAFRVGPTERQQLSVQSDSLSVLVARDARVALAEELAARAERLGLTGVRVRFVPADTAGSPPHPDFVQTPARNADYAISVDCTGGFASELSLVLGLPSSVSLQRLTAERGRTGTQFHLTLAVFEAAKPGEHG